MTLCPSFHGSLEVCVFWMDSMNIANGIDLRSGFPSVSVPNDLTKAHFAKSLNAHWIADIDLDFPMS